ncbi:CaiB/BaiF CoA transferase family protein [Alcaligenes faecalis]|uniref:Carnitine dehydratase n=1 Tax=Alcaligenes faecalis TaxID=511 RepID=A0A2U2BPS9_ALCFA|nr:CoA transferase [Alcaligenes faecalis]PWE15989.1 carnitine dehydratase [Alcaligenes faecalis]
MSHTATAQPLAGYKVIDLTTFLSGPFCTQVLGDLGAEVVKIEAPEGDSSRSIPPHFVGDDSAYYLSINRNKSSLAVNLKTAEGLDLVRQLILKADVVVENYRPGVAARLGLDPQALCEEHPGLVWASISGFGQTGPDRDKPAYDMIVQALSGVMSLTGEEGRPAVRLGIPAGDTVAGLYATIAINAALADRERTGKGRIVDVAMLDCQLAMLSYQSAYALIAGVTPAPQGAKHDSIPTYRSFRGGDGRELVVTANTERMWQGLCRVLGLESLLDDERFQTGASRLKNKHALWEQLESAFATQAAAHWIPLLEEHSVPVALIQSVPEALAHARDSERSMILALQNEDHSIEVVGNPIKFVGADAAPSRFPPRKGEDDARVLGEWLSLSAEVVSSLQSKGVLLNSTCSQA